MQRILAIDSRAADRGTLTRNLQPDTRVVLLAPGMDGIHLIACALEG